MYRRNLSAKSTWRRLLHHFYPNLPLEDEFEMEFEIDTSETEYLFDIDFLEMVYLFWSKMAD